MHGLCLEGLTVFVGRDAAACMKASPADVIWVCWCSAACSTVLSVEVCVPMLLDVTAVTGHPVELLSGYWLFDGVCLPACDCFLVACWLPGLLPSWW